MVSTRRSPKKWSEAEKAFQHFYGIDLEQPDTTWKPHFGSAIKLPLYVGLDENKQWVAKTETLPPTRQRLATHFGSLQWFYNFVIDVTSKTRGQINQENLPPQLIKSAQRDSVERFTQKIVERLRKALLALRQPLYLNAVLPDMLTMDPTTGQPKIIKGGEEVLALLPCSVSSARHYGLTEKEIEELAPQVIAVIARKVSDRKITTEQQFVRALDHWGEYVDPIALEQLLNPIRENHPQILTLHAAVPMKLLE
jgi:hypothetical protein